MTDNTEETQDGLGAVSLLQQALNAVLESAGPMLTQAEACAAIGCSTAKLHQMLGTGELPGLKAGKEWVIPRQAFFARINEIALARGAQRQAAELRATTQFEFKPARRGRRPLSAHGA